MDKLKERVKIKNIWTKNRIAVPPMVCFHWSDDSGCVTDKNLQHYRYMAAGGAGLIIAEATAVTKRGRLHETQLGLWEDEQTEGWKRLADAVHQYDVPFFVQLHHAGVSGIEKNADCPSDYSFRDSNGELRARGCEPNWRAWMELSFTAATAILSASFLTVISITGKISTDNAGKNSRWIYWKESGKAAGKASWQEYGLGPLNQLWRMG